MMQARQLYRLIRAGEGQHLEFKRELPAQERICRTLSAFANTSGGILLVGVGDDGQVVGLPDPDLSLAQIEQASRFHIDPCLSVLCQILRLGERAVLIVEVPESADKPHRVLENQAVYLRQGSATLPIGPAMIKTLRGRSEKSPDRRLDLDPLADRLLEHLSNHPRITCKQFCHLVNISERRAHRLLVKLVQTGILNRFEHEREAYYSRASQG